MKLNVKKLSKRLIKEYSVTDGYVRIDDIHTFYTTDMDLICIKGTYGYPIADERYQQRSFELHFTSAYETNYEYIAGMFAQILLDNRD